VPPHNPKDDGKQHGLPDHTTQQQHQPATSPRRLQRLLYENIYTIPNMLSATRLLLSPYIGYLLVSQQNYTVAFGAFAVAGITDLLDGWIARRFNSRTVLGSVLDPLADKSLMTVLTVSLTANQLLPLPLAALIIFRDVSLVIGAAYYRYISLPLPVSLKRIRCIISIK
jgi:cardiolipin synthase